jgi:hypothetical protein
MHLGAGGSLESDFALVLVNEVPWTGIFMGAPVLGLIS